MGAALMSFGAKNSREAAREKKKIKEYEVIMEEEIQFVQALQMPGTIEEDVSTCICLLGPKSLSILQRKKQFST